jgi:hypothetical protein
MHRMIAGVVAVAGLCAAFAVAQAGEAKPDATIELKGGSVAAGIGFSWGSGTLTYQGKHYAISADGFDVGDVGITNITAAGKVYNLKSLADFDGNYTAVAAGATAMGGGGAVVMQNQNGVKVELLSTTRGVKLALAVGGVKMKVKK